MPVRILRRELEALDELAARAVRESRETLAPLPQIVAELAELERERDEIMDALECLDAGGFEMGEWRPFHGAGLIFVERDDTPDLFEAVRGRA